MIRSRFIPLLIATLTLISCGGEDDSGATAGTFEGAIAFSNGQDGTISINIPEDAATEKLSYRSQTSGGNAITGECIFPDGNIPLEGTIDPATGSFTLTGGAYTFTGTISNGSFTGTLTESGVEAGSFSGFDASDDSIQTYCGTFESEFEESGVFLVVVSGNSMSGSYAGNDSAGNLSGTLNGNSFTLQSTEGGSAEGTVSGNSVSGSILNEEGQANGSFQGSTEDCF